MADYPLNRINLTFFWTRTFSELLQGAPKGTYPFDFLIQFSTYKDKYAEIKANQKDANGLSLPWSEKKPNRFWLYYFNKIYPHDISPNDAKNYLVPFRYSSAEWRVKTDVLVNKGETVNLEGLFYPHGVTLVMTVRLLNCASLTEWVERSFKIRRGQYSLQSSPAKPVSLNALSEQLLDGCCEMALGPGRSKGKPFDANPFSIVTIVQGDHAYQNEALVQGSAIHQAMEQLTTWQVGWPALNPPLLKDRLIFIKGSKKNPNHCVYKSSRGRLVWLPEFFAPDDTQTQSFALRWYHRNLVHASLQTESLGAFLHTTVQMHQNKEPLNPYQLDHARDVVKIIERLYNSNDTYRSWNIREQIDQCGFLNDCNYLRQNGLV